MRQEDFTLNPKGLGVFLTTCTALPFEEVAPYLETLRKTVRAQMPFFVASKTTTEHLESLWDNVDSNPGTVGSTRRDSLVEFSSKVKEAGSLALDTDSRQFVEECWQPLVKVLIDAR